MASKCYLLMTVITLLLLIPTVGAIAVYEYVTIDKGREERPPSPKRDRGGIRHAVIQSSAITVARRAQARPLPPGPRPGPSRHRCHHPLPPACAEPRPPHLVPSGLDTRPPHPCQEFREPPCPPPISPRQRQRHHDQRSVDATMDPSQEDYRPRATQSMSSSSTPPTTGGGGVQITAPCRSRDHSAALSGTSARSYLAVVIVSG
jgi:hypothetical protein